MYGCNILKERKKIVSRLLFGCLRNVRNFIVLLVVFFVAWILLFRQTLAIDAFRALNEKRVNDDETVAVEGGEDEAKDDFAFVN